MISILAQNAAGIDASNLTGATPLHYAASNGHDAAVRRLVAFKANINAVDDNRSTPLHSAAFYGHIGIGRFLLGRGSDPHAQDSSGATPIETAEASQVPSPPKRGKNVISTSFWDRFAPPSFLSLQLHRTVCLPPTRRVVCLTRSSC